MNVWTYHQETRGLSSFQKVCQCQVKTKPRFGVDTELHSLSHTCLPHPPDLTTVPHLSWWHCAGIEGISPLLWADLVWVLLRLFGIVWSWAGHTLHKLLCSLLCKITQIQGEEHSPGNSSTGNISWHFMRHDGFLSNVSVIWGWSGWEGSLSKYPPELPWTKPPTKENTWWDSWL
jgi:hypothetical protein